MSCIIVEPVDKVCKKPKPSSQKGAFASIFKKANQRETCKTSPGHHKASATAKVTTKTGNFSCNFTCYLAGRGSNEVGVIGIDRTAQLFDIWSCNSTAC